MNNSGVLIDKKNWQKIWKRVLCPPPIQDMSLAGYLPSRSGWWVEDFHVTASMFGFLSRLQRLGGGVILLPS
jgi:hypothetical protein